MLETFCPGEEESAVGYSVEFDSYMRQGEDLSEQQLRLFEVDRALLLPSQTAIRLNFTGADVIHS